MEMGPFLLLLFAGGIRLAVPLMVASLGETFAQRSGVLSVGIEGYMTFAAAASFLGSYYTGSAWLGVLMGMAAGGSLGLINAYFCVTHGLDQIVSGLGLVFLGEGAACCVIWSAFAEFAGMPKIAYFQPIDIPILSQLPIIGPILFCHGILTYIGFLLVPSLWFVLERTKFGLRTRAVGEFAAGSDTMGVNVSVTRYICTVLSGVMSGLAGAALCLEISQTYSDGMVAGRGFIILAAVVLGNWSPVRVFGACLLFGLVDAFQYRMQILGWWGVPWEFWIMTPYIATIAALLVVRRVRMPRELCIPYFREKAQ
jgi:ABC-type uncharacterized transport system permease subunit